MTHTAEQVRFHAAGHIAAAVLLTEAGLADAAARVMCEVRAYVKNPKVQAPPQVVEKAEFCAEAPNSDDLRLLEQWFCDPLNTLIEKSEA